jgi:hypothetical protein
MRRALALILSIIFSVSFFTGCSVFGKTFGKAGNSTAEPVVTTKPAAPTPTQTPTPTPSPTLSPSPTPSPSPKPSISITPANNSLTLEILKKGALDAGYKIDDKQILVSSKPGTPKPAAGFVINYVSENSQMQIGVVEFNNAADALTYAKLINSSGIGLAIINDKFFTMTRASYGIVEDDKQKGFLEQLLRSKVMSWTGFTPKNNYSKDYKGAVELVADIDTAYNILLKRSVTVYDKKLPLNDPKSLEMASFLSPLSSVGYYPPFCDDTAMLDQYMKMWEYFGVTELNLKNKPNDYVMTGKRYQMDKAFEIHAEYDPAKGSIRLVDILDGKEQTCFYEFIPLGSDKYAIQSDTMRMIIEYKNGLVTSFTASQLIPSTTSISVISDNGQATVSTTESAANVNSAAKDSIYPEGAGADAAWVMKAGESAFEQVLTFDGTTIKVNVKSFTGDRIKADIPKQ